MLGDFDEKRSAVSRADSYDGTPERFGVAVPNPRYGGPDFWVDDGGDKPGIELAHYWSVVFKHRHVIIGSLLAAIAIGVAVTMLMPPVFLAETTLQIDREAAKVVNVQTIEPEQGGAAEEFFQTQYGLLKSRSLALRTLDGLGMSPAVFLTRMGKDGLASNSNLAEQKRDAIRIFQKSLGVTPVRGSRLVKVTFESPDAGLAAQAANATAQNFISSNLDRRYESSDYAREFLEARLAEVKSRLEESERSLVDYATREGIINVNGSENPGQSGGGQSLTVSSLVALNEAFAEARGERIKAEQRWRQAQSANARALPEVLESGTIQELTQARAKVVAEYQEKLRVYKPDFPEMQQLQARVGEIDRQIQVEVNNVRESLKTQYEVALSQERSFESQVNGLKSSAMDLRERSIQYDIAQREVDTNRTLYEGLLQRYKEVGVAGGLSTNNVSIVDVAEPPVAPAKPRPLFNIALAAGIGLAIGILLALALELLDESIRTPEDVEAKLNAALIGTVPMLDKGQNPLGELDDPRSAFSEAYYSIRTSLQFSTARGAPESLLVTSARPSEGKSTSALAIARNFARLGSRVLLIDGDLRNPSMHRNLGADNVTGFSNLLTGSATLQQAAQKTAVTSLYFVSCGPLPPNPAELLASDKLGAVIREAMSVFDIVVVDGPPVMGLADAPMLAAIMSGTLFVIEAGGTRRSWARTAFRRLQVGNAKLLGVVLTKFNAKKTSYGANYAYAYDYGDRPSITAE